MAKSSFQKDVWKAKWERGEQLPGGNQGHTFYARNIEDRTGPFDHVIKILKRQDDENRRAMFCGEIRVMEVLDHPGIVEIADTNAEQFRDKVELYLVTTKVNGMDLEALVQKNVLTLDDAVQTIISVLNVIDHCHQRGVVHRDIKPCHVILRDGSFNNPVLIDFGLAYHSESQPTEAATRDGQGKGNRFLVGPEHLPGTTVLNRNSVTDICQCVGLLFFALTNHEPGALRDDKNQKPHERLDLNSHLTDLPEWKITLIHQIFDIGFEWEPRTRWQSASQLISRLEELFGEQPKLESSLKSDLVELMKQAKTDSPTQRLMVARQSAKYLEELVKSVVKVLREGTEELLDVRLETHGGHGDVISTTRISFRNKVAATSQKTVAVVCRMTDNNIISVTLAPHTGTLKIFEDGQAINLGQYDIGVSDFREDMWPWLTTPLKDCVAEVLGIGSDSGLDFPPVVG